MLTISIGAVTVVPAAEDEWLQFIGQVDKRLYRAKQQGRNCIVAG